MAAQRFSFTDEEMLEELRKLGYDEVSPDVFQMMKEDILKLAEQVESNLEIGSSPNLNASASPCTYSHVNISPVPNDNHQTSHRSARHSVIEDQKFSPSKISRNRRQEDDMCFYHDNGNIVNQTSNDSSSSSSEAFKSLNTEGNSMYKMGGYIQDHDKIPSRNNASTKTIKRKVMRHRNGQAVITEQFLPISVSESPCDASAQSNESISSDDLSAQSSGSSDSLLHPVFHTFPSNRSTSSLSSTRSAPPRIGVPKRKKSDPVAMYNYYRKFWDNFKPPGEKTHDKLRWTVRDKMLDYHL